MQITVPSHIGEDGILRLQIPVGIRDADLEVTINFRAPSSNGGWPSGYLEKVIGSWQGEFSVIVNEGELAAREELP